MVLQIARNFRSVAPPSECPDTSQPVPVVNLIRLAGSGESGDDVV